MVTIAAVRTRRFPRCRRERECLSAIGAWGRSVDFRLPITLLAGSIGVYAQHQFEDTFWGEGRTWKLHPAALHGSSHYQLPGILRWFTANIGVHHVHHLCSRIPYYRLPD